jgi:uncharacterized protein with HEPN domain
MQPDARDAGYLWDMLEAARTVRDLVTDASYEEFIADRKLHLSVIHSIQTIGEAANRVSASFCRAHPEIPWGPIVAQRNVIVHGYRDIEYAQIWIVATQNVIDLIPDIEPLVPPPPDED